MGCSALSSFFHLFSYFFPLYYPTFNLKITIFVDLKAAGRSAADAVRRKRKVRATQSILLPNRKLSAKVE